MESCISVTPVIFKQLHNLMYRNISRTNMKGTPWVFASMALSTTHKMVSNTWALLALSKKSKTLLEIYFIFLDSWHNYLSFGIWKTFLAQLQAELF